jgi:hypothetical protein
MTMSEAPQETPADHRSRWTKLAGLQAGFLGKAVDTSNPHDINFKDESTESGL